jgi:starch phosphorylase
MACRVFTVMCRGVCGEQAGTADPKKTCRTEVVPLFFDLDAAGLPSRWIRFMKHSIMTLARRYNADRMVMDYVEACYLPAAGGLTRG